MVAALSVHPPRISFRAIALLFMMGFKLCATQMIVIIRRRVAPQFQFASFKSQANSFPGYNFVIYVSYA